MNTQKTVEQLHHLKLHGMAGSYETFLGQPVQQQPETHSMIALLAESEAQYRTHQRTQIFLRLSKLRYNALPEQINCSPGRNLTKEQLLLLCDGSFIEKAEHVLITGATGCGKSYLACALGRQACILGYRTIYYPMSRFIEALITARLEGTYIKLLNLIAKIPLLIIDDFGLQPLDHPIRLALLQILEDRYGKSSTIITSQLPIAKWYDYIGEPTIADAIMDRLSARMNKIELKGESLRKRKNN